MERVMGIEKFASLIFDFVLFYVPFAALTLRKRWTTVRFPPYSINNIKNKQLSFQLLIIWSG